ncbi:MAG: serine/threonine protein kinase [Nannocystaceae bacterium]|nr:serine/threonine protein kinase [Nannocystaceae bacterium]
MRSRTIDDGSLQPDPPNASAEPPETIGRFTIVDKLGSGGMGTVYAAYDPELDRKIALKLLHTPLSRSSQHTHARTRLLREAKAIAKVSHRNVVAVYDVGVVTQQDDKRVFLAMELIEGPTLRQWMKQLHTTDMWKRGRGWRRVVEVMVQAGRGLAAAHAVGLTHRDFKPDNILVGNDGVVRVVDFGLAQRDDTEPGTEQGIEQGIEGAVVSASQLSSPDEEPLTATGAILGTPAYMAPEQFRGERTDARTDQFALCLTLYEALVGSRPFQSDSAQGLACAVMMGERVPWPTQPPVPNHLVALIERGLSTDPDARFESTEELVETLGVDPYRIRRRRLAWLGGGLALPAASSGGAIAAQRIATSAVDPCDAGPSLVAEKFGPQRVMQLRAALDDPSLPYASKTIDAVVETLNAHGAQWATAYRDACEATHVRHVQTNALLDQRMACLDRRLTALDATVTELVRDDQQAPLRDALGIVSGLPTPEPCADTVALQGLAPPQGAAAQQATKEVRRQLDLIGAKIRMHRGAEARELLAGLETEMDAVGYQPLRAEYLLTLAIAGQRHGNGDAARIAAREALMVAQAAGHDEVVRDAAAQLSMLLGFKKALREEALIWADLAEATAERVGWTDAKRADLLRTRAWVLAEWGLSAEAIEVGERALAAAIRAYGPDTLLVARAHSSLGSVYGRLRDLPKAQVHFRRAVELQRESLGDEHPVLVNAYLNLGNALSATGRLQEAHDAFDSSIALANRLPDVSATLRARTQGSLGNLLFNERRWEEALGPHQRALALREEVYGPDHTLVARSLMSLGNAYTELSRDKEAMAAYSRSLSIREANGGTESPGLILVLENIGMHCVRYGRPEQGRGYLLRVQALLVEHPQAPYTHAENKYWLGRAWFDDGTDTTLGLQLIDEAIAELSKLDNRDLLEAAQIWRATGKTRQKN